MAYYGRPKATAAAAWSMMRPGARSALPRSLSWRPLGPADNAELAALVARAEDVDDPPYRTTDQETAEYFLDPTYSGVAGRDGDGVMRAFGLVRVRPAAEIFASVLGVVDPLWRGRGIGGAILHWQSERARHLIGAERAGRQGDGSIIPAHIITTVLEDDERMQTHLTNLGYSPQRWYREVRRSLSEPIPQAPVDRFLSIEPWSKDLDEAILRVHNRAADDAGAEPMSPERWAAGRAFFAPEWSFVALDRSSDRARIAGYLLSSRYEQDWEALGWKEGYTDMLGALAEYSERGLGAALLAAAMRAYAADGMEYAAAGVDSASPTGAGSLYERLGYQPTRGTILYGLDV